MTNNKVLSVLKKNAMLIVLVLVYIFFTIMTGGGMFESMNFNALITQNAYVFILATGMLMCNINDYVQQVVKGLVLIAAVAFSYVSTRLRDKIITRPND